MHQRIWDRTAKCVEVVSFIVNRSACIASRLPVYRLHAAIQTCTVAQQAYLYGHRVHSSTNFKAAFLEHHDRRVVYTGACNKQMANDKMTRRPPTMSSRLVKALRTETYLREKLKLATWFRRTCVLSACKNNGEPSVKIRSTKHCTLCRISEQGFRQATVFRQKSGIVHILFNFSQSATFQSSLWSM